MKLGGIYISVRAKTTQLDRDLKKAKTKAERTAIRMEKALNNISFAKVGVAAAAFTVALGLIGKKVVSLGREFESNMKTVQAWSGAAGDELKDLTAIARKMGATTEHTATEAAGALKFLAAAGFSAKKSIAALPSTLNLATAGQVDLASATDITTDVLTAFGLQVNELNRVNDAFITTSSNSNTNVMMLGQSFKMVAPTAKLFNLTIEQTAAFLGTLANAGVKSEMAGSGLNMVLLRSAKAAKKLGMAAGTPLITILKKMKEEQWGAVKIGEAFGARQVKTAAILMNGIDSYEKLTKKIIENKGATGELATIIRDSLDVDIKTLNSTIQEELLRTFDMHKNSLREIVTLTTAWIKANPELMNQIGSLAMAMANLAAVTARGMGEVFSTLASIGDEQLGFWEKMFWGPGGKRGFYEKGLHKKPIEWDISGDAEEKEPAWLSTVPQIIPPEPLKPPTQPVTKTDEITMADAEAMAAVYQRQFDVQKQYYADSFALKDEYGQMMTDFDMELRDLELQGQIEHAQKMADIDKEAAKKAEENLKQRMRATAEFFGSMAGLMSQFNAMMLDFSGQGADQSRSDFNRQKNLNMAQAAMSTAAGVAKALESGSYAGIIMGALIAATGAVQIATISDQEYKYAKGGVFTNSVVTSPTAFNNSVMGEKGPEGILPLAKLPGNKLGVHSTGGGGITIINNNVMAMDSKSVGETLRRNPNAITTVINEEIQRGNSALNNNIKRANM